MKKLPDLDAGHSFYSKEADQAWEKKRKRLEKEEEEMVKKNREAWKAQQNKKKERGEDGDKEVS